MIHPVCIPVCRIEMIDTLAYANISTNLELTYFRSVTKNRFCAHLSDLPVKATTSRCVEKHDFDLPSPHSLRCIHVFWATRDTLLHPNRFLLAHGECARNPWSCTRLKICGPQLGLAAAAEPHLRLAARRCPSATKPNVSMFEILPCDGLCSHGTKVRAGQRVICILTASNKHCNRIWPNVTRVSVTTGHIYEEHARGI